VSEPEPFVPGAPWEKARRRRSLAIAAALIAFVAVVFVVTMVRMSQNTAKGVEQRRNAPVAATAGG